MQCRSYWPGAQRVVRAREFKLKVAGGVCHGFGARSGGRAGRAAVEHVGIASSKKLSCKKNAFSFISKKRAKIKNLERSDFDKSIKEPRALETRQKDDEYKDLKRLALARTCCGTQTCNVEKQ